MNEYRMVMTDEINNEQIIIPFGFSFTEILPLPKREFKSSNKLKFHSKHIQIIDHFLKSKFAKENFRNVLKQQCDEFTPGLIISRFDDLESKYNILYFSEKRIKELINIIKNNYDYKNKKIIFEGEYWELELHINNFFNEARSILELIADISRRLYPNASLPTNFRRLIYKPNFLERIYNNNKSLGNLLERVKNEEWLTYLVHKDDKFDKETIRNLRSHNAHIKIMVNKLDDNILQFRMGISKYENTRSMFCLNEEISPINQKDMFLTIHFLFKGITNLMLDYKSCYSEQEIIRLMKLQGNYEFEDKNI